MMHRAEGCIDTQLDPCTMLSMISVLEEPVLRRASYRAASLASAMIAQDVRRRRAIAWRMGQF